MSVENVSQDEKKELLTPSVQNGSQVETNDLLTPSVQNGSQVETNNLLTLNVQNNCNVEQNKLPTQVDIKFLTVQKTCCCCLLDMMSTEVLGTNNTLPALFPTSLKEQLLIGLINCCSHTFHFKCILAWSSQENSCPQCKRRFTLLAGYSCVNGIQKIQRRVAHIDQQYKPQAFRTPRIQRIAQQEDGICCFLCFATFQNRMHETSQNEWLQCSGDHGQCRISCHQFCFDQLTFPLCISNELRSLWFCPFCIRKNQCITSQRQRAIDCTAFLRETNLPPFSSTRSFTFSSGPDIIQPFIHFYRHMKSNLVTHKGKRKRLTTSEKNKKSFLSNSTLQKKKIKHTYDAFLCSSEDDPCQFTPPPQRGSTDDFQQYELNQRQKLGHEYYGKSMYSSRTDDGGILSGRDFVASLFHKPSNHTLTLSASSSSSSSSRPIQDQLDKQVPPSKTLCDNTTHSVLHKSKNTTKQNKSSSSTFSSSKSIKPFLLGNKTKKKPSPILVSIVKRYLKMLTKEHDIFKIICRSVSEYLVNTHDTCLCAMPDSTKVSDYWISKEQDIRDEVHRQWSLFTFKGFF